MGGLSAVEAEAVRRPRSWCHSTSVVRPGVPVSTMSGIVVSIAVFDESDELEVIHGIEPNIGEVAENGLFHSQNRMSGLCVGTQFRS